MKKTFFLLLIFFLFLNIFLIGKKINLSSKYKGVAIKKIERFLNGEKKEIFLNENEINEAIYQNKEYFPAYLKDFKVSLFKNSFFIKFYFYKSALKGDGIVLDILSFFLKKKNNVELYINFYGEKGFGKYEIDYLKLNGFKVPSFLVSKLVSELLEKYNFPYKPEEKFKLPFGIKRVIINKKYVKILK